MVQAPTPWRVISSNDVYLEFASVNLESVAIPFTQLTKGDIQKYMPGLRNLGYGNIVLFDGDVGGDKEVTITTK